MITIITAFIVKHFICDFLLQVAYHYKNKGTYGHPGGLLHAAIHGAGTLAICLWFGLSPAWAGVDIIIHYHIDWAKMNLNARMEWKADNSEYFWLLLGADQLLHYLTYVGIVAYGA